MNGIEIRTQDKDIEIERLQTTCLTLNNKVSIVDDLTRENNMLKKRLEESENYRAIQKEEIGEYERNRQEYERNRIEYEREYQKHKENYEREYERNRLENERAT